MTADDIIRVTRLLDNHIQILKFGQRQSRKEKLYPSLISLFEAFSPHNKVFLSIPKAVETEEEKDHQHIKSIVLSQGGDQLYIERIDLSQYFSQFLIYSIESCV